MLEVSQEQMEWVYQDGVEAAGGLSEGLHSVKVNLTTHVRKVRQRWKRLQLTLHREIKIHHRETDTSNTSQLSYSFFFLLKLFIYSLWILNHASWSYSSPCPFSSALSHCNLTSSHNKIKVKSIAITQTDKQKFSVWKLYCGPVSHTVYSLSSTCVFLQWIVGLALGLWLLLDYQCCALTESSGYIHYCCLVS